jgi:cell division protein FtsQ
MKTRETSGRGFNWRALLSAALWTIGAVCLIAAVRRVDAFTKTDARFTLDRTRSELSGPILVDGVRYASRAKIIRVFENDVGRSVFLMPLAERRRRLLAVDWVEEATVSRLWPNRVWIKIRERRPVAFIHTGGASKLALIDAHGVILEQPPQAKFTFPVLVGVAREQAEGERGRRVQAMLDLLQDLGPAAAQISEVDVTQPDSLVVVAQVEGWNWSSAT